MWWARVTITISALSLPAPLSDAVSLRRFRGPMSSPSSPPPVPCPGAPFPPPGPFGSGSPGSSVLRGAPTSCHPSRGARCLARRYRPYAVCFAPADGQRYLRRAWVLVSRVPDRLIEDGENRISRVPVRSSRCMPCSHQTPEGPERQAFSALAMLPSANDTASAPTNSKFRGSITRPASSLSTLRRDGYPTTTQDSLPGGGQPYPDGVRPAGSVRKVSE